MIRVLIADSQMLFVDGLRAAVDAWEDFEVVGCASSFLETAEKAKRLDPDIVLLDPRLLDALVAMGSPLICEKTDTCIVLLTMRDDEASIMRAVKAGVRGYLLKDTPPRRLRQYLRQVHGGQVALSSEVSTKVIEVLQRLLEEPSLHLAEEEQGVFGTLTERERDVLALVAEGLSNQEISERLFVSEKTVKKHLSNVFAKLGVSNRAQAAVWAIRAGLA